MTVNHRPLSPSQAMIHLGSDKYAQGIAFQDSSHLDAFGRLRSGMPFGAFDSTARIGLERMVWESVLNGAGASTVHLPNEASAQMNIGTVAGEYNIEQIFRYVPYIPGRSQLIVMTGLMGAPKENVISRMGYYDNNDGLLLEQNENDIRLVRRSSTSGTMVPEIVEQADWNVDTLDGSRSIRNPSGLKLDLSKCQIFWIDFQWLGVGRARLGVNIGGRDIVMHEMNHANLLTMVYMKRPNLPVRYEIRNSGTSTSPTSMKRICQSVASEAGYKPPGFQWTSDNHVVPRIIGITDTPFLAIRLKGPGGVDNRLAAEVFKWEMLTDGDGHWELLNAHSPTTVTGTWNDVSAANSAVEFSTDISEVSGGMIHVVESGFVTSAQGSSVGDSGPVQARPSEHNYLHRNYADDGGNIIVLAYTALAGTDAVRGGITWREY